MKQLFLFLILLIVSACSTKSGMNEAGGIEVVNYADDIITDSLLANIPLITASHFKFGVDADDNIGKELIKLNEKQLSFLYSSGELIKYREHFGFTSYFYGRMPLKNGLLPILIINTDLSHAIYLDCFLINKDGEVEGMFNPTYIEIDYLALYSRGHFMDDSTYNFTEIAYSPLENDPNTTVKDSSIFQIRMAYKAGVQKNRILVFSDTIKAED